MLLHYRSKVITLSGRSTLLHYQQNIIITLSGDKWTLVKLTCDYYIID